MTTDALGSAITAETTTRVMPATAMSWWNSLDCAGMNAAVPADSTPAPGTDSTSPYCKMYGDLEADAKMVVDQTYTDMGFGDATMALQIKASAEASAAALSASGASLTDDTRLVVKDDATAGSYALAVSAVSGGVTKYAIVEISIAGPPHALMVEATPMADDMYRVYTGGGARVSFTVTAQDVEGGVPHFTTEAGPEQNNRVMIDAIFGFLRGVDTESYLTLNSYGMGTFTYTLPRDASAGEEFEVMIGEGDMMKTFTVINASPAMVPGMPMNVSATATSHDMIDVSWGAPASDGGSAVTGYMVERGYMGADNTMMWTTVAAMTTDMMYMDTGLMAETTYYYRVTAMNDVGAGMASDGMAMAMTHAEMRAMVTAPSIGEASVSGNSVTVTWTDGENADQHLVVLFDGEWNLAHSAEGMDGTHTFDDVAAGDYTVGVVAVQRDDMGNAVDFQPAVDNVTVN